MIESMNATPFFAARHWLAAPLVLVLGLSLATPAWGFSSATRFSVIESSPSSWVARGYEDYHVTPADGWTFVATLNSFNNSVEIELDGPPLAGTTVNYWRAVFAAPFEAVLTPGVYNDFARYPFQDNDQPGLQFASTGRQDNTAAGFFEIYEAVFGPSGEVLRFSADFTHFGETNPDNFAVVEIRYAVEQQQEVPEPATASLTLLAGAAMTLRRRQR